MNGIEVRIGRRLRYCIITRIRLRQLADVGDEAISNKRQKTKKTLSAFASKVFFDKCVINKGAKPLKLFKGTIFMPGHKIPSKKSTLVYHVSQALNSVFLIEYGTIAV